MDLSLFKEILEIPSTSGEEGSLADFLEERLATSSCSVLTQDVEDGTRNLLFDWSGTGEPSFVFCTHLDTVPPYIPPTFKQVKAGDVLPDKKLARTDDTLISGRGTCDAKGQIAAMHSACLELESEGFKDFGLLLLSGEETGSNGARKYTQERPGGAFVLVGEPTDNCLVSACKGTKSFGIKIKGRPCHSGYPQHGTSAVDRFVDFMNMLASIDLPPDPVLGPTTWNVGRLESDNPQNILSPELSFRIYFRTTFITDQLIHDKLLGICPRPSEVEAFGGDEPMEYFSGVEGIESACASFGSDAPRLTKFGMKAICGPGSILTAHTDKEHVLLSELEKAVGQYVSIFKKVRGH